MTDKEIAELKDEILRFLSIKSSTIFKLAHEFNINSTEVWAICMELETDSRVEFLPNLSSHEKDLHVSINNKGRFFIMNSSYSSKLGSSSLHRAEDNSHVMITPTIKNILIGIFVTVIGGLILWVIIELVS